MVFLYIECHGLLYSVAGLSGVATHPGFRRQGYGRQVVRAASSFIAASDADFNVFTCRPALIGFYQDAGNWMPAPDVILVGNDAPDSLASDRLGLTVMMRLLSGRAIRRSDELFNGTITLGLPGRQFL